MHWVWCDVARHDFPDACWRGGVVAGQDSTAVGNVQQIGFLKAAVNEAFWCIDSMQLVENPNVPEDSSLYGSPAFFQ